MNALSLARFALLVLLFGSLFPAPASAQARLAMPNAGFEEGDKDLAGWEFSLGEEGQGDWAWETKRVHSGKRAIRVRKSNSVGYSMLASDYIPLGRQGYRRRVGSRGGRSHANVYFMISQHTADCRDALPERFQHPAPALRAGSSSASASPSALETRAFDPRAVEPGARHGHLDDFELEPAAEEVRPRYEKPRPEELPPLSRRAAPPASAARRRGSEGSTARPLFFDGRPVVRVLRRAFP